MDEEIVTYECKEYDKTHALGLIRDPEKHAKFLAQAPKHEPMEAMIPGKLDLSSKVSLCENQGSCGSCWDFGITKAFRSAYMLAGKDPGRLAFNYLLNNCGPQSHPQWGCNGGDFDAGQVFLKAAPWLESQDPYQAQDGDACKNFQPACDPALTYKVVGDGQSAPTFQELAEAMAAGHMLVVDVAVQGSWGSYSGGIYNGNGSGINHIVNMVGYDMQTSVDAQGNALFNSQGMPVNGDGYLIVMNNWGESWGTKAGNGHGGYMFTRWGRNQIAETAMYYEVKQPAPPPPPPPPVPTPGAPIDWKLVAVGALAAVALIVGVIAILRK